MTSKKSVFETLSKIDVSNHVQVIRMRKGPALKYVSWAWAWSMVKSHYPTAMRKIETYPEFAYDEKTGRWYPTGQRLDYRITPAGCEVKVTVEIDGERYSERLYVMDMRNQPVMHPNIAQINKTQQRCLVKALAMAGLGLNLYAGEDLPIGEVNAVDKKQAAKKAEKDKNLAQFEKEKKLYVHYIERLTDAIGKDANEINEMAQKRLSKDKSFASSKGADRMHRINAVLQQMLSENGVVEQESFEEVGS